MKKEKNHTEDMLALASFISENSKSGQLHPVSAMEIKKLFDNYKLPQLKDDCVVITCDVGVLGSVIIHYVESAPNKETLKYERGNYDYISVKTIQTKKILWTDYKNIEPYNRQGGLYCNGASFKRLGSPIIEKSDYREFIEDGKYNSNTTFAVEGFMHNDYYGKVRFGMCIEKENVDEFILQLRKILGK